MGLMKTFKRFAAPLMAVGLGGCSMSGMPVIMQNTAGPILSNDAKLAYLYGFAKSLDDISVQWGLPVRANEMGGRPFPKSAQYQSEIDLGRRHGLLCVADRGGMYTMAIGRDYNQMSGYDRADVVSIAVQSCDETVLSYNVRYFPQIQIYQPQVKANFSLY